MSYHNSNIILIYWPAPLCVGKYMLSAEVDMPKEAHFSRLSDSFTVWHLVCGYLIFSGNLVVVCDHRCEFCKTLKYLCRVTANFCPKRQLYTCTVAGNMLLWTPKPRLFSSSCCITIQLSSLDLQDMNML